MLAEARAMRVRARPARESIGRAIRVCYTGRDVAHVG
jgi:hypothetical protein